MIIAIERGLNIEYKFNQSLVQEEKHDCMSYAFHTDTVVCIVELRAVTTGWTGRKIIQAPSRKYAKLWMMDIDPYYEVVRYCFLSDVALHTEIPIRKHIPNFVDITREEEELDQ